MNGHFIEAASLFAVSLLLALMAIMTMRTDNGWALVFAILSGLMGVSAFWVIFADVHRTQKLFGNQSIEPK